MTPVEKNSSLLPVEQEVSGKSWAELFPLAKEYRMRAYSLFDNDGYLPSDSREQYLDLMYHAGGIEHEAKLLRTHEILRNPAPTEEEEKFARFVIWNEKVNKLLEGRLPPHPSVDAICQELTHILQELPPPDGRHITLNDFWSADIQS